MKRDMKPFVVEVKRGTRRSSFLGAIDQSSTMSEAQRRAEVALFASPATDDPLKTEQAEPARRILRSLVEPKPLLEPDLDVESYAEPRRPRPVGRPRKPRPVELSQVVEPAPRPRLPVAASAPTTALVAAPPAGPLAADAASSSDHTPAQPATGEQRQRLRERSRILARYVLGTEPAPGEQRERSWRRAGRSARRSAD